MKRKLLFKAKTLREAKNDQYSKVFIKPDLTPIQRQEEQMLLKEMRRRNEESKAKKQEDIMDNLIGKIIWRKLPA